MNSNLRKKHQGLLANRFLPLIRIDRLCSIYGPRGWLGHSWARRARMDSLHPQRGDGRCRRPLRWCPDRNDRGEEASGNGRLDDTRCSCGFGRALSVCDMCVV